MALFHAWDGNGSKAYWAILKVGLSTVGLALGYFTGFATTFEAEGVPIVLGICAVLGICLVVLVFLPIFYLVRRFASQASPRGFILLAFVSASLYTAFWFILTYTLPFGDFYHPSYAMVETSLIQFASLAGLSGIAFVVAFAAFLMFFAILKSEEASYLRAFAIAGGVALLFASIWGSSQSLAASGLFYQAYAGQEANDQTRVACMIGGDIASTQSLLAADDSLSMVVWSELSGYNTNLARLQEIAKATQTIIVPAYSYSSHDEEFNMMSLINEQGQLLFSYKKSHPVPGLESVSPGPGTLFTGQTALGVVTGAICFDLDFPSLMMSLSQEAQLLVQPSWTWGSIGKYHARINAVRAIEHGITLVRCSSFGYSGVFHPTGEWTAFVPDDSTATYRFVLPKHNTRRFTVYRYLGETWSWICVVVSSVVVALLFFPERWLRVIYLAQLLSSFETSEGFQKLEPSDSGMSASDIDE